MGQAEYLIWNKSERIPAFNLFWIIQPEWPILGEDQESLLASVFVAGGPFTLANLVSLFWKKHFWLGVILWRVTIPRQMIPSFLPAGSRHRRGERMLWMSRWGWSGTTWAIHVRINTTTATIISKLIPFLFCLPRIPLSSCYMLYCKHNKAPQQTVGLSELMCYLFYRSEVAEPKSAPAPPPLTVFFWKTGAICCLGLFNSPKLFFRYLMYIIIQPWTSPSTQTKKKTKKKLSHLQNDVTYCAMCTDNDWFMFPTFMKPPLFPTMASMAHLIRDVPKRVDHGALTGYRRLRRHFYRYKPSINHLGMINVIICSA